MVDIIRNLCEQNGTSLKALERTLGFGNGTIRRWGESSPSFDKIQKVADYFGISVDYLLTGETKKEPTADNNSELNYDDAELLDAFKKADENIQELIRRTLGLK